MSEILADQIQPDGFLYHYTSRDGLIGILRDGQLWATNILFLNDSREFFHAVKIFRNVLEEFKRNNQLNQEEFRFLDGFSEDLNNFGTPINQGFDGIYTCSFSTEGNQLSQWRGYSPKGGGFSIGFDFNSSLKDIVEQQGFTLRKCFYDETMQSRLVERFLKRALVYFHDNADDWDGRMKRANNTWDDFLTLAPLLKDSSFVEENEWRLISKPTSFSKVEFRSGKSMLVPYVKIDLEPPSNGKKSLECIPEIYFGPALYPHLSHIALKGILQKEQVRCEILPSEIPYRVE